MIDSNDEVTDCSKVVTLHQGELVSGSFYTELTDCYASVLEPTTVLSKQQQHKLWYRLPKLDLPDDRSWWWEKVSSLQSVNYGTSQTEHTLQILPQSLIHSDS